MKIKTIQEKISDKHNDSFWYDGLIAEVVKPNGTILQLCAEGEIRIYGQNGLVHDGYKERDDGIEGGLNNDDDIENKIGQNYDDKYYWENNNWFEVYFKRADEKYFDSVMGDVGFSYDEGLEILNNYYTDDNF